MGPYAWRVSDERCERCGEPLPEGARFCPNCGFPAGQPAAVERKTVTILFADVARSTELAGRLDPERLREVMAAFFKEVTDELDSLRGRAESFAGDAVMGVFGVPQAHDDDAIRAVRAALSIRDRVERLGEDMALPARLQVRVGINTGAVAIGAGVAEQHHLAGTEVNLAARLQQAADPGEILVGETTWQIANRAVDFGPQRKIEAKGFDEPVLVWPVVALSAGTSRRTIPLVDRRSELALIVEAFQRTQETSRAHLVSLLGEPGIGKSRVSEEFLATLPEGTKVLTGRASVFEEDVTFAPVAHMVRQELGVERDTPEDEVRRRLEEVVRGCCEPSDVEQVTARLGVALGMGTEARDEHKYRVAEVRAGLITFLTGLGRRGPVVLLFEDLHLAQPPLLDLIDQVAREARWVPALLLCVARWDLLEKRDDWGGGLRDALTLYLEPLSLDDATELAMAAGKGLDRETADRIARHAGGNPFFIVETTGMLMHEGGEFTTGPIGPRSAQRLPPTVQAVVASRIDHLPPDARELVRRASVFPRGTFHEWELALIGDPTGTVLATLEAEELLVRETEQQGLWRFRHPLLRDVAYESLAKRERQRLHLQAADGLAGSDPERHPRSIAYHLEQAARAALDLGSPDRALADRAVEALARAGDVVRTGVESRAAVDLYERALAIAGSERTWGAREAGILAGLGEARYWLGEFEEAAAPLKRALEIAGDDVRTRADASRFLADITLSIYGDRDRAGELFDQALTAARELGDPWTLARTILSAGWAPYWRDDLAGARAKFEEALAIARAKPDGDPWAEARALVSLAVIISPDGDELECERLSREALAIGEQMDDPFTVAVAQNSLARSLRRMLRPEEAEPFSRQSVVTFRQLGARWELADALISHGQVLRQAGRLEEAEASFRESFRLCRDLKERSLTSWVGEELMDTLVLRGDLPAARQVLEEAASLVGGDLDEVEELRYAHAVLLLAEGEVSAAAEAAAAEVETERNRGWRNQLAAFVWWTGRVFGAQLVGGEEELSRAREVLEAAHWEEALRAPDLVRR